MVTSVKALFKKLPVYKIPCKHCGTPQERNKQDLNVRCYTCKIKNQRAVNLKNKGKVRKIRRNMI